MEKFDVYLRVDARLNYNERHIFLQSFDEEEKAIAFCQSLEQNFYICDKLQCAYRTPKYQPCEAVPLFIRKREEDSANT